MTRVDGAPTLWIGNTYGRYSEVVVVVGSGVGVGCGGDSWDQNRLMLGVWRKRGGDEGSLGMFWDLTECFFVSCFNGARPLFARLLIRL